MGIKNRVCLFHRRITDPDDQSALVRLTRGLLWPLSILYSGVAGVRNRAFHWGIKKAVKVDVPVVSVGNITVGGTGKTPFVAWLCEQLRERGREPAILSRGYGADSSAGVDDENEMLGSLVHDVPVVVNPERVEGAKTAIEREGADVLVMDDGFQHRRLARDCDIVLVDALNPFGGGHAIPLGTLREPIHGLSRAHALVITRVDQVESNRRERLIETLEGYAGKVPIATARHAPCGVYEVGETADKGGVSDIDGLREQKWGAFCGIGNPEGFRRTLKGLGVELAFSRFFPDHHGYGRGELRELQETGRRRDCAGLITTEKDAVKIRRLLDGSEALPVIALCVRLSVVTGEAELWREVENAIEG